MKKVMFVLSVFGVLLVGSALACHGSGCAQKKEGKKVVQLDCGKQVHRNLECKRQMHRNLECKKSLDCKKPYCKKGVAKKLSCDKLDCNK
jgi:hypothetical protein